MEIDKITLKILNDKPKPKFTNSLNLDINMDKNQQLEIIILMFLRAIEEKMIKKENKDDILRQFFIIRLYLNSCGIDIKYTNIEKKKCISYNLTNYPVFYAKNKYNSLFSIMQNIYRKGRMFVTYYNMKEINTFNDVFIIIRIENHFFKIEFDLLKK